MTANITTLRTERDTYVENVVAILEEALELARAGSFTSCVVVMANETSTVSKSAHLDRLRLMGALAHAQHHIYTGGNSD